MAGVKCLGWFLRAKTMGMTKGRGDGPSLCHASVACSVYRAHLGYSKSDLDESKSIDRVLAFDLAYQALLTTINRMYRFMPLRF